MNATMSFTNILQIAFQWTYPNKFPRIIYTHIQTMHTHTHKHMHNAMVYVPVYSLTIEYYNMYPEYFMLRVYTTHIQQFILQNKKRKKCIAVISVYVESQYWTNHLYPPIKLH